MNPHRIISFESTCEGAGKTTQALDFTVWLQSKGLLASYIKFPFGDFRKLLLQEKDLDPKAQMLIFHADFAHTLERKIKPLLAEGSWVILDRYIDSSFAYQGAGHNISGQEIQRSLDFAVGNYVPRHTFLLDLSDEESRRRLIARGEQQRLAESYGTAYSKRVREGYEAMAIMYSHRIYKIDADQDQESVRSDIRQLATSIELEFRDY